MNPDQKRKKQISKHRSLTNEKDSLKTRKDIIRNEISENSMCVN